MKTHTQTRLLISSEARSAPVIHQLLKNMDLLTRIRFCFNSSFSPAFFFSLYNFFFFTYTHFTLSSTYITHDRLYICVVYSFKLWQLRTVFKNALPKTKNCVFSFCYLFYIILFHFIIIIFFFLTLMYLARSNKANRRVETCIRTISGSILYYILARTFNYFAIRVETKRHVCFIRRCCYKLSRLLPIHM